MARGFEALGGAVAAKVLLDAIDASQRLSQLGVPHALIGGLAVGVHGHPRATKDADFLVGSEAFESTSPVLVYRTELRDLVRIGVVDLLAVPPDYPSLAEHLMPAAPGEIPIIAREILALHDHQIRRYECAWLTARLRGRTTGAGSGRHQVNVRLRRWPGRPPGAAWEGATCARPARRCNRRHNAPRGTPG